MGWVGVCFCFSANVCPLKFASQMGILCPCVCFIDSSVLEAAPFGKQEEFKTFGDGLWHISELILTLWSVLSACRLPNIGCKRMKLTGKHWLRQAMAWSSSFIQSPGKSSLRFDNGHLVPWNNGFCKGGSFESRTSAENGLWEAMCFEGLVSTQLVPLTVTIYSTLLCQESLCTASSLNRNMCLLKADGSVTGTRWLTVKHNKREAVPKGMRQRRQNRGA